jgi:multiple sugar transport system permease protein
MPPGGQRPSGGFMPLLAMRFSIRIPGGLVPYLLLAPALSFVLTFILYPLGVNIYTSVQHRVFTEPLANRFVGLANFLAIARDPTFWLVLRHSAIWVVGSLVCQFLLGLVLALLLNEKFPARGLYRSLILSPWAISGVIIAIMWKWMYNPQVGVINELLVRLGLLSHRIAFLADPTWALAAVMVTNVWRGTPFFAVMLLAALQAVPKELYEAAAIDGAGAWQRFLRVTLPAILPMVFAALLLRTIWIFNDVDLIFVMTDGGPVRASETLATFLYKKASRDLDFGLGSALAMVMFAILMTITALYYRAFRRSERI